MQTEQQTVGVEGFGLKWEQICANPQLQNLPYKIELNQWEQIVMSPASIRHVLFQDRIAEWLKFLRKQGKTLQEFPVETTENVKAPDVIWMSDARLAQIKDQISSPIAPEVCIEVMSPGNTKAHMLHKSTLYFAAGAQEVWLCDNNGTMEFYTPAGQIEHSQLVPDFPLKVEI
jgi:Uma2 family endonuclease